MNPISLFVYNIDSSAFNQESISEIKEVNFLKIISEEIGEFKNEGNHHTFIGKEFKIYLYQQNKLKGDTELMIVGNEGVKSILNLVKKQNWTLMHPTKEGLISLNKFNESKLVDYLNKLTKKTMYNTRG